MSTPMIAAYAYYVDNYFMTPEHVEAVKQLPQVTAARLINRYGNLEVIATVPAENAILAALEAVTEAQISRLPNP